MVADMARPIRALPITEAQRNALRAVTGRPTSTRRAAWRAQIILYRAEGLSQEETARRVGVNRPVVVLWEKRFMQAGLAGLAMPRDAAASRRSRSPPRSRSSAGRRSRRQTESAGAYARWPR